MEHIRSAIKEGASIKWVGYRNKRSVHVHIYRKGHIEKEILHLQDDYTEMDFSYILSSSATKPGSVMGTIWNVDDKLELLRLASILGVNPGADCNPGVGKEFKGKLGCIMAYDIEQDRSRLPLSSFPTFSESITCIAAWCSCGDSKLFSFIQSVKYEYVCCRNSRETVELFLQYVEEHSPQWLVGYNNFRYDNTCLAFHADMSRDKYFMRMRVGAGSSLSYAYYIDIPGTYNVDILAYLDKTRRSAYPNMSLSTLVQHHKVGKKMDFDTADLSDIETLFKYNMHDSKITMELASASNVLSEITSLAVVSCSPIIDCARFISGTLAACSIASYCLSQRICMDWSPCVHPKEYRGAEVLEPIIGLHENVVSCDFSSMYPTVLVSSNISIENQRESPSKATSGAVQSDESVTRFSIDDLDVSFELNSNCVIPPVMKLFIEKRREVKKSNPAYALGLKIAANSIYGSLGDRHSRIYSPNCSAAVTTGGRWCLATAEVVLRAMGYEVVYGDTDSCFVAPKRRVKTDPRTATKILSEIFLHTPFPGMCMEVENTYDKIAFLGKKTYFGKLRGGSIVSKGMSRSRKDRIGICRFFSSLSVPIILSELDARSRRSVIGDMLCVTMDAITCNRLSMSQVSKIVKRGGTNYYEYVSVENKREWKECESHTGTEVVEYSADKIAKALKNEVGPIFAVTGVGSISSIIKSSNII